MGDRHGQYSSVIFRRNIPVDQEALRGQPELNFVNNAYNSTQSNDGVPALRPAHA